LLYSVFVCKFEWPNWLFFSFYLSHFFDHFMHSLRFIFLLGSLWVIYPFFHFSIPKCSKPSLYYLIKIYWIFQSIQFSWSNFLESIKIWILDWNMIEILKSYLFNYVWLDFKMLIFSLDLMFHFHFFHFCWLISSNLHLKISALEVFGDFWKGYTYWESIECLIL